MRSAASSAGMLSAMRASRSGSMIVDQLGPNGRRCVRQHGAGGLVIQGVDDALAVVAREQFQPVGHVLGPHQAQEDAKRLLLALTEQRVQFAPQIFSCKALGHDGSPELRRRTVVGDRVSA
jgi:hypothetical protein